MNASVPSFLFVLQGHAHERGERLAHVLSDRDITYRRLWSRIERASARLQGEWGVQAGDTVAYIGAGHPDAIVLYFALLRIGASLLPLEAMTAADARAACKRHGASLAVHEDNVSEATIDGLPSQRLEMLLDDWCHFEPVLVPEDPMREALWLPVEGGGREANSLYQLTAALPDAPRTGWVGDRIFTPDILGRLVLPSLRHARRLFFSATEPQQRTGS
ncbi:MAG: hypothetical protein RL404_231 [Pseudomonadota bacterium]|jgi:acyl-coenzyme A synthetase/AMP-(fatty) acid ligase